MKELSIEEKARRYDEAKYIMKGYLESGNAGVIAENTIKKAFPELKESEDVMMVKFIKNQLFNIKKTITDNYELDVKLTKAIDWLEKQAQKPINKIQLGKKYKCIASPRYSTFMIGKIYKPEDKFLCSLMNFCSDCFEPIEGEQKPDTNCLLSWSEMDEKMLQSLEGIVKDYWAKAEQEKNKIKIREASNVSYFLKTIQKSPLCWIKCSDELPNKDGIYLVVTDGRHNDVYDMARYDSIKGWHKASEIIYWMPIPQLNNKSIIEQKPAWSEENDRILSTLTKYLEEHGGGIGGWECSFLSKWLKSLRTQPQWKPSDEQMHALHDLNLTGNISYVGQGQELINLYNDLKKLKGE